MSTSLVKLIDAAIVPAILMVLAKMIGVFGMILALGAPVNVREFSGIIPIFTANVPAPYLDVVSSYSDLFLLIVLTVGFGIQLLRSAVARNKLLTPKLIAKLARRTLPDLVIGSFDLFHSSSIWLIFLWVSVLTVWINIFALKSYLWIGMIGIVVAFAMTITLLRDVYMEIETGQRNLGKQHL